MDDLNQQISQFLSDPQNMKQLQDMAAALGLGNPGLGAPGPQRRPGAGAEGYGSNPSAPAPPAAAQPAQTVQSASTGLAGGNPLGALGGISPEILQMLSRAAPLLNAVNREDDSTRLLRALRPLLSPARQQKLDEAIKILHMMRLMPLLKESGLFSGLLSGLL